ncbi:MAG TPA: LysM domain-containing protein [Burkholderiales bacterium]|nr:LysM domain-containing protein [Burkholderiales bacterium]
MLAFSAGAAPLTLQDKAPSRYVVVPGDTLWGISARFLKDPWRWPEIWGMNREEIKNPELIYPGDVIVLGSENGKPRLRLESGGGAGKLETIRLSPSIQIRDLGRAIPSIPLSSIGPFLSKIRIIDSQTWDSAPDIVASEGNREIIGTGDFGYVSGLEGSGISWDIYGNPRELKDPASGKSLGMEVDYLGSAKLVREGKPAKIEVVRSVIEIGVGDRLLPTMEPSVTHFVPHAPDKMVKGIIFPQDDGYSDIGQNDVVAVDLGKSDGLELGDVLAVYRAGDQAMSGEQQLTLPPERIGLVMVFRIYDRISFALVVRSEHTIHAGDTVRTP